MARVIIVGSGVVGTATGRGLHRAGHDVTMVDIVPEIIHRLRAEGLRAQATLALGGEPALIFLTLPTPAAGHRYDLEILARGVADVGRALARSPAVHTVVVRSTVPPGTTEGLVGPLLETESGRRQGHGFELACAPEFLRAASADDDFRHPRMTVIAARELRNRRRLGDLLAPFGGMVRFFEDPATAEFIKCAHNLFNAAKISFWNEMWLVARRVGVDPIEVAGTVALSAEGSVNPQYGIRGGAPYGGACLPKDATGFLGFAASHGVDMPLLQAVIHTNEHLRALTAQRGLVRS